MKTIDTTKPMTRRLQWRAGVVGMAILAFPCISGCATLAQEDAHHGALPVLPTARLSLDELVALTRQGLGAEALIARIRQAGGYYRLSASDVISLRERGLPIAVIDHMLAAERQFLVRGEAAPVPAAVQDRAKPPKRFIPALYMGV
jgi:hypothetical protein